MGLTDNLSGMWDLGFIVGGVFLVWVAYRLLRGRTMHLYLLNRDSVVEDQMLIPVTSIEKNRSILRGWFSKIKPESIDLSLTDHNSNQFLFEVQYAPFRWFVLKTKNDGGRIERRSLKPQKTYWLRDGMKLWVGERDFTIKITSQQLLTPAERAARQL